jgi:hypothetical protein
MCAMLARLAHTGDRPSGSARIGQVSAPRERSRQRERPACRGSRFASRAPHTNTLTLTPTRPASRRPRAGPSGGPQLPDTLWLGACRGNPDRARRSAAGTDARRDEGAPCAAEAGWVVGPSGEYSTYSTDEQRGRRPGSARHATWSGYRDRLLALGLFLGVGGVSGSLDGAVEGATVDSQLLGGSLLVAAAFGEDQGDVAPL